MTSTQERKSLEERLHRVHQQLALLADVFECFAAAPDYVRDGGLSAPACRAITDNCRHAADDLRDLLDRLPPALANWDTTEARSRVRPRRRERR